ncbi:hypothetical protein F4556_004778 [Kitasatospora gansuensis]|uniref:Uncharacterized protein n=1 Tax=Kitasatospora gansuensis TaxID=258050 RepID=A0A7W7WJJ7_9ACTN|nr:hypothetical protein [Kitasatospora gansuensis]MBB4949243.1 hypothetical protein [Kitasatospora gansuensis]
MGAFGRAKTDYWEGCTPARIAFVDGLRGLIDVLENKKHEKRAQILAIPTSTLSCYWSGRRVPNLATLRGLHAAVTASVGHANVPVTLQELEQRRITAAQRRFSSVTATPAPKDAAPSVSTASTGAGPAQDRQGAADASIRQVLADLGTAHAAGDRRSVITIAWSANKTLTPGEIGTVVTTLHADGDADLAEAVLLGGRDRSTADTMRLALALIDQGLAPAAEQLMQAVLPTLAH